jgi:hypothetical protein
MTQNMLHYSNIPFFEYSITPLLQYSITPFFYL